MGEKGKVSRIFNLSLGSYLTFAALDNKQKTADGQLNIDEINSVKKILF